MLRRLPRGALRPLARVPGLPQQVDAAPLARIAGEPVERLRDPRHLADDLLPSMGLGEFPHLLPDRLAGQAARGVRHWQYPAQFGPFLADVGSRDVSSYLEIGVWHGGTFAITVEVLRRLRPLRRAVAVDLWPVPLLQDYAQQRPEVRFVMMDSRSRAFRRLLEREGPFDLVLIDGNHEEDACRSDFQTVCEHARLIALHDICEPTWPGVGAVWREVRRRYAEQYEFREFTAQYPEVAARPGSSPHLGIGLAIRGRSDGRAPALRCLEPGDGGSLSLPAAVRPGRSG